ncbi:MAG TPA: hypothetical protein DCL77_08300 [Prolixibacteraceae bacterium]|jgi:hypothetical protein|nr:hypothetical protein [Prolixibacteraceae bacterium]
MKAVSWKKGGGFFLIFVRKNKTIDKTEAMAISLEEYTRTNIRLNEMIDLLNDETPENDLLMVEFLKISKTIETYEKEHFPLG